MDTKKRFILAAVQLPIMLLVGILFTFAYSLQFKEEPGVDWLMASIVAFAIWGIITVLNKRDERRHESPK